ncbi:lantibiotic dehydratase [Nonomuraea harbinensis]|uniref:Lantibiotic dehydratase n=1 Tax=Nonomuraea harbinensis TaxID=1286938 RepID=A0ABW1BM50_9ACTN|nr:lantibiotic dehydratase [Nonomuraea harbinensis]
MQHQFQRPFLITSAVVGARVSRAPTAQLVTDAEGITVTVLPRYEHTGLVMVRATTDPGDLELPTRLDLSDETVIQHEGRTWLAKAWARDDVREALRMATPVLASRIDRLLGCEHSATADLRRAILSTTSYLLRWQRRATPFGLFAGVTTATVGPAKADFGKRHRARSRVDAEWLMNLIDQCEQHPTLRPRLKVITDSAGVIRDGRFIVAARREVGARTPGPLRDVSVRLTRPVRCALVAAAQPIQFDELADELSRRFPATPPEKIHGLLHTLVDQRVLITSLRPPMTVVDPLEHLIKALRIAGCRDLPDIAGLLRQLECVQDLLTPQGPLTDQAGAAAVRAEACTRMNVLAPEAGLATDVRLDATITVPEVVLKEAELAATALLRLCTEPFGRTAWMDYHARFLARYGRGALVPVRELVGDVGLGYPPGYLGAPRARPAWRMLTERDAVLLALIQETALSRCGEITLTEAHLEALTVGDHTTVVPPRRIELGVALHAESAEMIDRGEFELWITAAPRSHTSMAGRFAYLLDDDDRARLAASYQHAGDDVVTVQLSFPPRRPHNENVVRVAPLLHDTIHLSEHAEPGTIDLDDLAVTADAAQMYLVQRSTGRRVISQIPHALDTVVQSPPLARFLAEVAEARSAVFTPFTPGAARTLPYIPRIRYRRTVLCAARWILSAADLPSNGSWDRWESELHAWRTRWRVPARVVLCHGELRLPLDLDRQMDRAVLRTRLERAERIELKEDGPSEGQEWMGRPGELLIPMTAIGPSSSRLPSTAPPGAVHRPGTSEVVRAHLIGNPARFDAILTQYLPSFVDELSGLVTRWWVSRHRDMIRLDADQHLALFVRLTDRSQYGRVAVRLAAFAEQLEARGLLGQLALTTHYEQPGRYGDGDALQAAEQVFAADTLAAIAQITAAESSGLPGQPLAAASMVHLAVAFAPDAATGLRSLIHRLDRTTGPLDRSLRDHALRWGDPTGDFASVRSLPEGEDVVAAWHARGNALRTYRQILTEQRDPATVLRTLLHEHHVRALGVDPAFEQVTNRLARAVALRRLALVGAL